MANRIVVVATGNATCLQTRKNVECAVLEDEDGTRRCLALSKLVEHLRFSLPTIDEGNGTDDSQPPTADLA